MGFLSKHVILTANEYGPRQIIHLPQNDSGRELVCEIGDMEIPRGSTARFWAAKPSRKVIYNDCTVQENQVIIPLKNQTLAEAGLVTAQVEIQNAGNLVKTFCFFLEVEKEAGSTGTESANESTYLEQYLEELQAQLTEAITESLGKVAQAISASEVSSKRAEQAAQNANAAAQSIFEIYTIREITIPADGWRLGTGTAYYDLNQSDITEDMMPIISIWTESLYAAKKCGMSTVACTFAEKLRVYAEKAPTKELYANLLLLKTSGGTAGGEGGGNYVLPVATPSRLGGVKVGENVEVTPDGTISVDEKSVLSDVIATDIESKEMIDSIFGASISQI